MGKGLTDAEMLGRIELMKSLFSEEQIARLNEIKDVKTRYDRAQNYRRALDKRPRIVKRTMTYFTGMNPKYTDIDILIESLLAKKKEMADEYYSDLEKQKKEIEEKLAERPK